MKIILGSAQIGLSYGVTNSVGQPGFDVVSGLLDTAYESGVRRLDSAEFYGNANERIGEYHRSTHQYFGIINKILRYPVSIENLPDYKHQIVKALNVLSIECYDTLMIHDPTLLLENSYYSDFLLSLKKEGVTRKVGVSLQSPDLILDILSQLPIDVIQLPVNLFDQRLLNSDALSEIKARGIEIHARSLFLQGILLSNMESLPAYFHQFRTAFDEYETFCEMQALTKLEATLSFIASIPEIDHFVIGCQDSNELSEIIRMYKGIQKKRLSEAAYAALMQEDEGLINPVLWGV